MELFRVLFNIFFKDSKKIIVQLEITLILMLSIDVEPSS